MFGSLLMLALLQCFPAAQSEKPADISACRKGILLSLLIPENEEIQCSSNQNSAKQSVTHVAKHAEQCGEYPANRQAQDNLRSRAAQNTIHVEHLVLLLPRSAHLVRLQDTEPTERKTGSESKIKGCYFSICYQSESRNLVLRVLSFAVLVIKTGLIAGLPGHC